jgi:hypothetical protein
MGFDHLGLRKIVYGFGVAVAHVATAAQAPATLISFSGRAVCTPSARSVRPPSLRLGEVDATTPGTGDSAAGALPWRRRGRRPRRQLDPAGRVPTALTEGIFFILIFPPL